MLRSPSERSAHSWLFNVFWQDGGDGGDGGDGSDGTSGNAGTGSNASANNGNSSAGPSATGLGAAADAAATQRLHAKGNDLRP